MTQPLWRVMEEAARVPVVIHGAEYAAMLRAIADYTLDNPPAGADPVAFAVWLREEAYRAQLQE